MLNSLKSTFRIGKFSLKNKYILNQSKRCFSFSELDIIKTKVDKNVQAFKVLSKHFKIFN